MGQRVEHLCQHREMPCERLSRAATPLAVGLTSANCCSKRAEPTPKRVEKIDCSGRGVVSRTHPVHRTHSDDTGVGACTYM